MSNFTIKVKLISVEFAIFQLKIAQNSLLQAEKSERWEKGEVEPQWVKRDNSGRFASKSSAASTVESEDSTSSLSKSKFESQISENLEKLEQVISTSDTNSVGVDTEVRSSKGLQQAIAAGAALLASEGIEIGVYLLMRNRYLSNLKKAAKVAEKMASEIDLSKLPDISSNSKQITLFVEGFAALEGHSDTRTFDVLTKVLKDHHVFPVRKLDFDIPSSAAKRWDDVDMELINKIEQGKKASLLDTIKQKQNGVEYQFETAKIFLKKFIEGKNIDSINIAAVTLAFRKKYPDIPINIIGHSAGGTVVREADKLLNTLEFKAKALCIGSPDFGLLPKSDNIVTLTTKKDWMSTCFKARNAKSFDEVEGHNGYLKKKAVRQYIANYFVTS